MNQQKKISYIQAFTILELMITVALLGVILTLAVPSFGDYVERQAVKSDISRFSTAFTSARSQAMTAQAGSTSVCWNNTAAEVAPANLAGTAARIPAESITVFEGGPNSPDGYGGIISVLDVDLNRLSYRTNDADNCIGFNAQGRLIQANVNGASFVVCKDSADATNAIRIDISIGGRISVRENTSTSGTGVLSCT